MDHLMVVWDIPGDIYSYIFILVLFNSHTSNEVFPGVGGTGEGMPRKTQEFTPSPLQRWALLLDKRPAWWQGLSVLPSRFEPSNNTRSPQSSSHTSLQVAADGGPGQHGCGRPSSALHSHAFVLMPSHCVGGESDLGCAQVTQTSGKTSPQRAGSAWDR